jgi:bacteriocin biosynthesis cyclodehydratase domain-containing protein
LYRKGLQYIRLSAERAVLKRGINELLLSGADLDSIIEPLLAMLDGRHGRQEIIDSFPGNIRHDVDKLLHTLVQRRLVTSQPEPDVNGSNVDSLQSAFWWNFGDEAAGTPDRLAHSNVVVVGVNRITRALVRSLLDVGFGQVQLFNHPVLDSQLTPIDPAGIAPGFSERFSYRPSLAPEAMADATLVCAATEFGQPEALFDLNRMTLAANRLYLPAWIEGMHGYVGPLNYPFESACLRCYRARADSNVSNYEATIGIREHFAAHPEAHFISGLLPPMAGMLGEILAMEAAKCIAGFPPSAAIGRIIEVNMASFGSTVRRVLKIPRCPDCSAIMSKATVAATINPLLPGY